MRWWRVCALWRQHAPKKPHKREPVRTVGTRFHSTEPGGSLGNPPPGANERAVKSHVRENFAMAQSRNPQPPYSSPYSSAGSFAPPYPTMNPGGAPAPPAPPHLPLPVPPQHPQYPPMHPQQPSPHHSMSQPLYHSSYGPAPIGMYGPGPHQGPHIPTPYPPYQQHPGPFSPAAHMHKSPQSPTGPSGSGPFLPPGALENPQAMQGSPPQQNPYASAAEPSHATGPMQRPFMPSQQPHLGHHPSIIPETGPPPQMGFYPPPHPSMSNTLNPTPQRLLQTAEVKLEISCKGLRDRDVTSKSDPTCVVFLEERNASYGMRPAHGYSHLEPMGEEALQTSNTRWREVGRTEYIKNNLNPHFKVQVPVQYRFEQLQHIRLGLWDIDSKKNELRRHDFLGDVRTTLGELVASRVWTAKLTSPNLKDTRTFLGKNRDLGTVTVIVHENQDGGNLLIKASLSGQNLDRKDILWSDPYYIVHQVHSTNPFSSSQLYKSEVVRKNCNPTWKRCQFKAVIPKGGDKSHVVLEFLVNDKDYRKRDDEIGVARANVADLEQKSTLPIINEARRRKKKKRYTNSGTLELNSFTAIRMPSLVDYLQGGLKLHFSVAVDLTASNGPPSNPESLHYGADMYAGNQYINALRAVADVLAVYTPSGNRFAAYGFGAELPGSPGITSSCFPLGLGPDPGCVGIQGILHAYSIALNSVKFSGPTYFAPLIDTVSRESSRRTNSQTDQNYDVLLILTDGALSDYNQTVDRIINASKRVPLSIIIIGIGNRDFKKMKDLDSDNELLTSHDGLRQAARDICQFVAINEFQNAPPELLGAAVLQELPGNIVEFFVGSCEPPIMPGQRPMPPSINY